MPTYSRAFCRLRSITAVRDIGQTSTELPMVIDCQRENHGYCSCSLPSSRRHTHTVRSIEAEKM